MTWWPFLTHQRPPEPARSRPALPYPPQDPGAWARARLAEVEQVLADFARSEGRAPSGSVADQVRALIARVDEQDRQTI